ESLGETALSLPIDHAEIDSLGARAHLPCHVGLADLKDLHRSTRVDVLPFPESLEQLRILGHVSQDAELDLGIVSAHQAIAGGRYEGCADLTAELAPDRDILEVGVRRRNTPRRRDRLLPGAVHASGLWVHERRERIDVR